MERCCLESKRQKDLKLKCVSVEKHQKLDLIQRLILNNFIKDQDHYEQTYGIR